MVLIHVTPVQIRLAVQNYFDTLRSFWYIEHTMAFAVIQTGGKQYKVSEGSVFSIEKLDQPEGAEVTFDKVLLYAKEDVDQPKIGAPFLDGASVAGVILKQYKDDKKIVFKYTNKTRYKKRKGHRQPLTQVKITKISA